MPVSINHVNDLREGGVEAHRADLHRLGYLLEGLAKLGQMVRDGADLRSNLTVPDVVALGATVARDLCRSTTRTGRDDAA